MVHWSALVEVGGFGTFIDVSVKNVSEREELPQTNESVTIISINVPVGIFLFLPVAKSKSSEL